MEIRQIQVIGEALKKCREVLTTNAIAGQGSWVAEAATTHVLIYLKDALEQLSKAGHRISFTEDVLNTQLPKVKDVTDLIREARNAACHITSPLNEIDLGPFRFNRVSGRGVIMKTSEYEIGGEYADDVAIFYGHLRVYLKRHVTRAYDEAYQTLQKAAEQHGEFALWYLR